MRYLCTGTIRYRGKLVQPGTLFTAEPEHIKTPLAKGRCFEFTQSGLKRASKARVSPKILAAALSALRLGEQQEAEERQAAKDRASAKKNDPPPPVAKEERSAVGETPKPARDEATKNEATKSNDPPKDKAKTK